MKNSRTLAAILFAVLPFASQGLAQEEPTLFPGTVSKVTLSLTITSEVEGTVAKDQFGKPIKKGEEGAGPEFNNTYEVIKKEVKIAEVDEYVSKFSARKYSIKELLTDLVTLEVIDEIKGYSLVKVVASETEGNEVFPGSSGFFLIKKGADPVDVSDYFDISFEPHVLAQKEEIVTPFSEGAPSTPVDISYSSKFKGEGSILIDLTVEEGVFEDHYSAEGAFVGSEKTGTVGKDKTPVYIEGAGKLTGLFGYYRFLDDAEGISIFSHIEGSAAVSAGAPSTDVSSFFPPMSD